MMMGRLGMMQDALVNCVLGKLESDGCGVRTHALSEWRLKPPP